MKKLAKSILSLAVALIMVFGVGSSIVSNTGINAFGIVAEAAAVKLSAKSKTIYYGASTTLKVLNTKKKVTWTTGNKNVATVTAKGKVTGKNVGTTYIYAKVGTKKYKCKVVVKDRNQTATRSFKVNGGGYFVKGESTAKVTVKAPKYASAKGYVYIQNSSGTTVFSKTYNKMVKGKAYSFNWNGKNSKGKYVPAGSYRVLVKLGTTKAYTGYLKFIAKNDFANGNGSKANPFEVGTIAQLTKIVKYSTAYFKQTSDLDFGYEAVGGFFSEDQQFNGTYDGNGKTISNIAGTEALFEYVGAKGVIKNLKMKGCSVVGEDAVAAILCENNYGKITDCNIDGVASVKVQHDTDTGLVTVFNYGTISNCVATGSSNGLASGCQGCGGKIAVGGIASRNMSSGKIISCESKCSIKGADTYNAYPYLGGIAGINEGIVNGCESSSSFDIANDDDRRVGGIIGCNNGQIIDSYYTGSDGVNITGENDGTIV